MSVRQSDGRSDDRSVTGYFTAYWERPMPCIRPCYLIRLEDRQRQRYGSDKDRWSGVGKLEAEAPEAAIVIEAVNMK